MGASSSTTQMPFDSTFLQYFPYLHMEYNKARQYIHCMIRCMEFIEEEMTYFRGFVDRQKEIEVR